jgi:hypothetical protein
VNYLAVGFNFNNYSSSDSSVTADLTMKMYFSGLIYYKDSITVKYVFNTADITSKSNQLTY